jgi:hypothetical protein
VNACGASGVSVKKIGFYSNCAAAIVNTNTATGKDIGTKVSGSSEPSNTGAINTAVVTSIKTIAFPNPAKDKINVQFNATTNTNYTISITDMVGRTIVQQNKLTVPGYNIHSFNVANFSKGTYIIKIQSKDEKQLLKVNVE